MKIKKPSSAKRGLKRVTKARNNSNKIMNFFISGHIIMEKLNWLNDVPDNDVLSVIDGDALYIAEKCGIDTLFKLWRGGALKQTLRISEKELIAVKKLYIRRQFDGRNVKDLSRLLEVSEKFVYDTLNEKRPAKDLRQISMFED